MIELTILACIMYFIKRRRSRSVTNCESNEDLNYYQREVIDVTPPRYHPPGLSHASKELTRYNNKATPTRR